MKTGSHTGVSPAAAPRTTKSQGAAISDTQPSGAAHLVSAIDRTRHVDVGETSRLADRALKVLDLALQHYSTDGLTAGEIAEILTKTFRLPAKPNAVAMALAREQSTANMSRRGNKNVFHITQPGEQYLAKLRAGTEHESHESPAKSTRVRKPSSTISRAAVARQLKSRAKTKPGLDKQAKRANSSRLGPKAAIERLITIGFFSSARTISQVREELKHRLGYDFAVQELSISLVRLLRSNSLQRERNAANQYEYRA